MVMLRIVSLLGLSLVVLTGCSGSSGHSDLIQYMQEVRQRPSKPIEPIPPMPEYRSFTYSAAGKRSPFDPPIELIDGGAFIGQRTDVKPDPARPKEPLENFSISSLSMVGTIGKDGALWALVDDGLGTIHRVGVGNYMGRNHGKIVGLDNYQINLLEIVPDGSTGWIERPKIIKLAGEE